jgi:hypothetical protein
VPQGALPRPRCALLGQPPLGPSSHGCLSSAPGAPWHGGLGLVLHEVGLLLLLAPLRLPESAFLTMFHGFPALVSAIVIILLIYVEIGQLHMYMCV